MKKTTIISAIIAIIITLGYQAEAQTQSKITAIVNKADWCSVCVKHGDRAMATLMNNNPDMVVHFIMNDKSDEKTKANSEAMLKEYGYYNIMLKYKPTGMVYFFNNESKKLISKISVSKSDENLREAINEAILSIN